LNFKFRKTLNSDLRNFLSKSRKVLTKCSRYFLLGFGLFTFLCVLLSLTDLPYLAYHRLGTINSKLLQKPELIVVLGGAGMPSPDGFIRCYYAAEAAKRFKEIPIVIALPSEKRDSTDQLSMMAHELMIRGVDSSRIQYEPEGFNTRSQALNVAEMFKESREKMTVVLITSPEHMYRSVLCFQKAGFKTVGGVPAFEKPLEEKKIKDKLKSSDRRVKNLGLRYNVWSYLQYELLVMKEYTAIAYYKLKGWI
jgi:uncharacterized SAM-binding protein YcdF (DUF218 family)